jgi:molybdopterin-guanine dinucleotide biosynthesis protein A
MTMRLAGVVLAGGASSRMGRTKALVEVDGQMMADRVLDALRSVGAHPVVVYGGDPEELAGLSAPVVPDAYPGEGPVAGVLGALEYFADSATHVLVLPCDVAMMTGDAIRPLVDDAAGDAHSSVWVAATDRIEPMCAVWSIEARQVVAERFAAGERALHRVIGELPHVALTVEIEALTNINTPDELPG